MNMNENKTTTVTEKKPYKVHYNYNIAMCNVIIKTGIRPIGCGTNDKTGNTYLCFRVTPEYYDLCKLFNEQIAISGKSQS